jgi:hypothetical protein
MNLIHLAFVAIYKATKAFTLEVATSSMAVVLATVLLIRKRRRINKWLKKRKTSRLTKKFNGGKNQGCFIVGLVIFLLGAAVGVYLYLKNKT